MEALEADQTSETAEQGFCNSSKPLSEKSMTDVFFSPEYGTIENSNIGSGEKTLQNPVFPQNEP